MYNSYETEKNTHFDELCTCTYLIVSSERYVYITVCKYAHVYKYLQILHITCPEICTYIQHILKDKNTIFSVYH